MKQEFLTIYFLRISFHTQEKNLPNYSKHIFLVVTLIKEYFNLTFKYQYANNENIITLDPRSEIP